MITKRRSIIVNADIHTNTRQYTQIDTMSMCESARHTRRAREHEVSARVRDTQDERVSTR